MQHGLKMIEVVVVAVIGGYLFYLLDLPLPWVLGSLTFVMLWQGFTKRKIHVPDSVRNGGFIILGIYFGLYFTKETFETVIPYLFPYVLMTFMLIVVCVVLGAVVTRWIDVDRITSVFSLIPGGLSEMALASEDMKGNSGLVVIFQTIRLVAVLFLIPPFMIYFFQSDESTLVSETASNMLYGDWWSYLWFLLPIIVAIYIKDKIPAGIIIGALGITAIMNVSPVELASIPVVIMNAAQVAVGASLGKKMVFADLKKGGKYILLYFGLAVVMIVVSFGLGTLLSVLTTLNRATAILSIAPGGFFEMVLTAYNVGGDPAVVSALQLVRVLCIVLFVPPALKYWFGKINVRESRAS